MKHAVIKEKPLKKIVKIEPVISVKGAKKTKKIEALAPVKITQTKAVKKSDAKIQNVKLAQKTAKSIAVVSKSKSATVKISLPVSGKTGAKKKTVSADSHQKIAPKTKKTISVTSVVKPKSENQKVRAVAVKQKTELKIEPKTAVAAAQKIKPRAKKVEAFATTPKPKIETQIIKSAVNIGKINVALKAIESAQAAAAKKVKKEIKMLVSQQKPQIAAPKMETANLSPKIKPKNTKPIGAAVFRGKKNRYDFQVYPLDFEFENISAIYVISKRKTDSKKRGHHALVCIGQTDSVVNELKKHTKGKCVKKHEANVISILPEASEKRRLKIEEDLKAAHTIVCNID